MAGGVVALAGLGGLVFVVLQMSKGAAGESAAGQAIREDLGLPEPESPASKKDRETVQKGDTREKYTPTEREVIEGLVSLNRARWETWGVWANRRLLLGLPADRIGFDGSGTPPVRAVVPQTRVPGSPPGSTPADRKLLAEIECRRAVDFYKMPAGQLPLCITTVASFPLNMQPSGGDGHFENEHAYYLPGGQKMIVGI